MFNSNKEINKCNILIVRNVDKQTVRQIDGRAVIDWFSILVIVVSAYQY